MHFVYFVNISDMGRKVDVNIKYIDLKRLSMYNIFTKLVYVVGKMKVRSGQSDMLPKDTSGEAFCSLSGDDSDDYCQEAGIQFIE